jgi:uncharacterized membrane protein (UPF0127 family)
LELADTTAEQERGLMERTALAPSRGMIFSTSTLTMWMHNTRIPLDMIFASKDGVVVAIMSDEQPVLDDFLTWRRG